MSKKAERAKDPAEAAPTSTSPYDPLPDLPGYDPEPADGVRVGESPVPGITLKRILRGHTDWIARIAWSPDGRLLASPSGDRTIRIWDVAQGECLAVLTGHNDTAVSVAWSPDRERLASSSNDTTIRIWDAKNWTILTTLGKHVDRVNCVAWSPDRKKLASCSNDHTIRIWNAETWETLNVLHLQDPVSIIAWSADARELASGSKDRTVRIWHVESGTLTQALIGHGLWINSIAWLPNQAKLASGSADHSIRVWDLQSGKSSSVLEAHTGGVRSLSFSAQGALLASKARADTICLWDTSNWEMVAALHETHTLGVITSLAFHPYASCLATLGESERTIRIWDIDIDALLDKPDLSPTVKYTSAKIVLVGESNVGKSCLAMRLAEDRYPAEEEQGTTHGMRFWPMAPEKLSPSAAAPEGELRDVVLWDMGGQDEYRLVHQLFLHDTTLALVLLDPTRGRTACDEAEAWNKRLEKQLAGQRAVKLLVGAKLDQPSDLVDRQGVERLLSECGFANYYETSARTGRGVLDLREAMAGALDWSGLAKTHRPELFQRIRDEIERQREAGEVVLFQRDLNRAMRRQFPELYEPQAVGAVADQLAAQGVIAVTRLASGEPVLVLQIGEIERYAGSLIVAARDNPRGVPALEMRRLTAPDLVLPGIPEDKRLPGAQERVVLECTLQLLIAHGICHHHEGLLVFPSLYRPTERDATGEFPHAVSLYYDFSGAIDNIYASLVAWLVIGKTFGRVRLWRDRAEFEVPGAGTCGLRKVARGGGFAHVDVYFEDETAQETRQQFITFVEEHLREYGVQIVEHVAITCVCGFQFEEGTIRQRIAEGNDDIGCPRCDRRTQLTEGAIKARERDPELAQHTWALRTEIKRQREELVKSVAQVFAAPAVPAEEPIRILHLSDLHFTADLDPLIRLQPLVADLHDEGNGLGFEHLDYLAISGDLTNAATPQEFEAARQFVSGIIDQFRLTAERCIIVPGNHDLSWEEQVYTWKGRRPDDTKELTAGSYVEQKMVLGVRDEARYPRRFHNFSHDFYHPLVQQPYPLACEEQFLSILFEQTGIQFLTLNSSWQIDEWNRDRSGIHQGALERGLKQAEDDVRKAREAERLKPDAKPLRIAVWHHPVTGNEKILDDAFMQRLRQAGVRLCLHGHVHEDRAELFGYLHPRKVHVAGAGSFGAVAKHRPESTPRLYNLVEVARDHSSVKVYTRCMRRDGGAWEPYAVWPGEEPGERRAYYTVD